MKELPKFSEWKTPPGYFDALPDQILLQVKPKHSYDWIKWAAVTILFLSIGIYYFLPQANEIETALIVEEIDLYIDSNYWTAEDILSLSDNPDQLLDELLSEESRIIEEAMNQENSNPTTQ